VRYITCVHCGTGQQAKTTVCTQCGGDPRDISLPRSKLSGEAEGVAVAPGSGVAKVVHLCTLCGEPLGEDDGDFHAYHVPGLDSSKGRTAKVPARGASPPPRKKTASSLGGVCPKCGSTQFKAVRSLGRKAALGFASLLTSANQVECVMCGAKFKRG
jgi:hypothetical protein